jgi:hypothetical protein
LSRKCWKYLSLEPDSVAMSSTALGAPSIARFSWAVRSAIVWFFERGVPAYL